jgi:hypothetical protein
MKQNYSCQPWNRNGNTNPENLIWDEFIFSFGNRLSIIWISEIQFF